MNYLHPNEPEREDTFEEHIHCNRLFVRALSFLLKKQGSKEEGVVVDMDGERFVVHTSDKQISISPFEIKNIPEGTLVWLHDNFDEKFEFSDQYVKFCEDNEKDIHDESSLDAYVEFKKSNLGDDFPGVTTEMLEQHIYNSIYKDSSPGMHM